MAKHSDRQRDRMMCMRERVGRGRVSGKEGGSEIEREADWCGYNV